MYLDLGYSFLRSVSAVFQYWVPCRIVSRGPWPRKTQERMCSRLHEQLNKT